MSLTISDVTPWLHRNSSCPTRHSVHSRIFEPDPEDIDLGAEGNGLVRLQPAGTATENEQRAAIVNGFIVLFDTNKPSPARLGQRAGISVRQSGIAARPGSVFPGMNSSCRNVRGLF